VKKLRKSVNICQSYHTNKRVSFFMAHSVYSAFSKNPQCAKYRLRLVSVSQTVSFQLTPEM